MGLPIGLFLFQLWGCPASAVAVAGIRCSLADSAVLRDGLLVPVQDSSLPLLRSRVVTTLRVCLPRAPGVLASGSGLAASA